MSRTRRGNEIIRATVLEKVLAERERQDLKWGDQTQNSDSHWTVILTEELGEVAREVYEKNETDMYTEIIQCAAVCFAWAEAYLNRTYDISFTPEEE
jgi:NTP pyrophosphatase (non-canonical NTP hydrolase)